MVTMGISMRILVLFAALLMCAGSASASECFRLGSIAQHSSVLRVNVENSYNEDISNARVKAVIPELGIIFPAKTYDLKEDVDATLFMPYEEVPEGEYLVRMSISRGGKRKIAHRYVWFG